MLTNTRKQYILDALTRDGEVTPKGLSQALGLSEDTLRRDIRELAQEGLLQRVHGGALPASPALANFAGRAEISTGAKMAIGRAAAGLIKDGQIVILDGGTSCVQVARSVPKNLEATIITHSPNIALEFIEHPQIEVILIGGRLFKHSIVSVGAAAIEAIRHIRADMYFMGVTGIHAKEGLSTGYLEEAYIKHALCKQSAETFVLASSEKIGAASQYIITTIENVSGMIVEESVPDDTIAPFVALGLTVIRG